MQQPDKSRRPWVGVGLFVLDERGRFILMQRAGSHGAGAWGLVGGHVEYFVDPRQAAADEAMEELGLVIDPAEVVMGAFTNDLFHEEERHYVTLYGSTRLPVGQVPRNLEPHKCARWDWFTFDAMPEPLFIPVQNFLLQPLRPPFR